MGKRFFLFLGLLSVGAASFFLYWREHRYDEPGQVAAPESEMVLAYFAGGCFWCTEADFEKLPGVLEAVAGYTGGFTENPTYETVSSQATGHIESVEVRYDPARVTYEELVRYFFSRIDPTDAGGQFVDRGPSYISAVFYRSQQEKQIVREEMARLNRSGAYSVPLTTQLRKFGRFYVAEDYHQDFWRKNSWRYRYYRQASGRDDYRRKICALREEMDVPCFMLAENL